MTTTGASGTVMKHLRLDRARPVDRRDFVLESCRGRSVLHLGCVDYPFLSERLRSGTLLHAELGRVADTLYGLDLDPDGIAELRREGFDNLLVGDIERLDSVALDRTFDVVLAAEIVEHLANPGLFLRGVPRCLAPGGRLIVTVPSATSLRLWANAMRSREVVHPDHNAYYSPHTLAHLLDTHGFEVETLAPYWAPARSSPLVFSLYDRVVRLGRIVSPWLGEGLVAIARLRAEASR